MDRRNENRVFALFLLILAGYTLYALTIAPAFGQEPGDDDYVSCAEIEEVSPMLFTAFDFYGQSITDLGAIASSVNDMDPDDFSLAVFNWAITAEVESALFIDFLPECTAIDDLVAAFDSTIDEAYRLGVQWHVLFNVPARVQPDGIDLEQVLTNTTDRLVDQFDLIAEASERGAAEVAEAAEEE